MNVKVDDGRRMRWLLDMLSPSMFSDHGIAALQRVALKMRAAEVHKQTKPA